MQAEANDELNWAQLEIAITKKDPVGLNPPERKMYDEIWRDCLKSKVEAIIREGGQDAQFESRYAKRRLLSAFPDPIPEHENPRALFKNGWLRKGGGAFFISVSGAGKSVASTQFAECFALGRSWFGISPLRPLKISVYQAEDDDDEVGDFRNNIRKGLKANGWTDSDIAIAEANITYHDPTGLTGDEFLDFVTRCQKRDKADLLIVNPLQSYAGCDIGKNAELSHFLRARLDPILKSEKTTCGCIIIHHTNKVPANAKDRALWLDPQSAAYAGAGGAEIVNWARAILTLRPVENVDGFFDLIAAKRGGRLGWKDAQGNSTKVKTIAYSTGYIFWREPSSQEIEDAKVRHGSKLTDQLDKVVKLCEESDKPFASKADLVTAIGEAGIAAPTLARKLIETCLTNKKLASRRRKGANAWEVGTPAQLMPVDPATPPWERPQA